MLSIHKTVVKTLESSGSNILENLINYEFPVLADTIYLLHKVTVFMQNKNWNAFLLGTSLINVLLLLFNERLCSECTNILCVCVCMCVSDLLFMMGSISRSRKRLKKVYNRKPVSTNLSAIPKYSLRCLYLCLF